MDKADAIAHDDWHTLLDAHPIFHFPAHFHSQRGRGEPVTEQSLELSTNTLSTISQDSQSEHGYVLSGRRQLMALKDADLIVAAGSELRMTSLWDTKLGRDTGKSYKVRRSYAHGRARHGEINTRFFTFQTSTSKSTNLH